MPTPTRGGILEGDYGTRVSSEESQRCDAARLEMDKTLKKQHGDESAWHFNAKRVKWQYTRGGLTL